MTGVDQTNNLKLIVNTLNQVKAKTETNEATIHNIIQRLDSLEQSINNINISNIVEYYLDNREDLIKKQIEAQKEVIDNNKKTKKQLENLVNESEFIEKELKQELSENLVLILKARLSSIKNTLDKVKVSEIDDNITNGENNITQLESKLK